VDKYTLCDENKYRKIKRVCQGGKGDFFYFFWFLWFFWGKWRFWGTICWGDPCGRPGMELWIFWGETADFVLKTAILGNRTGGDREGRPYELTWNCGFFGGQK
jgi:hypothetical protein